jgi:micrococcal nuclease
VKSKFWLTFLLGLVVFLFLAIRFDKLQESNITSAKVLRVIDGDTIEVIIDNKKESVRLIGIDAPELTDSSMKGKLALESKEYLKKLLENKNIRLERDTTQDDRDIYQRLLRYVFLEDGTLINKKMIEAGMAEEYTYKKPYKYQLEFREAGN